MTLNMLTNILRIVSVFVFSSYEVFKKVLNKYLKGFVGYCIHNHVYKADGTGAYLPIFQAFPFQGEMRPVLSQHKMVSCLQNDISYLLAPAKDTDTLSSMQDASSARFDSLCGTGMFQATSPPQSTPKCLFSGATVVISPACQILLRFPK
jgi:hypothetical protein